MGVLRVLNADKACIDQSDIAANLACLPVFLSGCKELLCLAGATYHTRLWCVMELFTFVQMGGDRAALSVVELGEGVRESLSRFDASKARCFLSKDRHHLLAVMEAGFGDLQPFNRVVRRLLKERTVDRRARPWALRRLGTSSRVLITRTCSRVLPLRGGVEASAGERGGEADAVRKEAWVGP